MKQCIHFPRCGGCSTLDVPYAEQLAAKERIIEQMFTDVCTEVLPVIKSPVAYCYRHKVQLPFGTTTGTRGGAPLLGCYANNSHAIVDQQMCLVQNEDCTTVAGVVRAWAKRVGLSAYHEQTRKGFLRHLLLRRAAGTGEILIGLVTNGKLTDGTRQLSRILLDMIEKKRLTGSTVVGIVQNVNTRDTNVVLGTEEYSWWGRAYLKERLGTLGFKIGLSTFFQVNPFQTPNLYNEVLGHVPEGAKVLDCYCGVGSITLWVAHRCRHITGIEENSESVRAARTAAKLNAVENASFIAGDVLQEISRLSLEGYSCAIVDPPRKGIQEEFGRILANSAITKIIYVSCNPESLKRDMVMLSTHFRATSVRPVDMFPHTEHIESVAVLERR